MKYVYESCLPVATFSTKKTLIIQSQKVSFTNHPNTFFKDSKGICWKYVGEFQNGYIPSVDFYYVTFDGNYFEKTETLPQIYYPTCESCLLTQVSGCTTVYFMGERCDNNEEVVVKICDVGPTIGTLKLLPKVGDVCGIENYSGDDFCVKLTSIVEEQQTPYIVSTPAWKNYDCVTCPIYKQYEVSSIDGFTNGLLVYSTPSNPTYELSTIVNLNIDKNCYIVTDYLGLKLNFLYDKTTTPTISETFQTTGDCINNLYKI